MIMFFFIVLFFVLGVGLISHAFFIKKFCRIVFYL